MQIHFSPNVPKLFFALVVYLFALLTIFVAFFIALLGILLHFFNTFQPFLLHFLCRFVALFDALFVVFICIFCVALLIIDFPGNNFPMPCDVWFKIVDIGHCVLSNTVQHQCCRYMSIFFTNFEVITFPLTRTKISGRVIEVYLSTPKIVFNPLSLKSRDHSNNLLVKLDHRF